MAYRILKVRSLTSLQRILKQHEVPFETWGQGPTKTVEDLWKEIQNGESRLAISKRGKLMRLVERAQALVYHEGPTGRLFLRESMQVFANGTRRIRKQDISVSEKRQQGERALTAMARGIREELGITLVDLSVLERIPGEFRSSSKSSKSYPGLIAKNRMTRFRWLMPIEHFDPEGYVEHQPQRKTTCFDWMPA